MTIADIPRVEQQTRASDTPVPHHSNWSLPGLEFLTAGLLEQAGTQPYYTGTALILAPPETDCGRESASMIGLLSASSNFKATVLNTTIIDFKTDFYAAFIRCILHHHSENFSLPAWIHTDMVCDPYLSAATDLGESFWSHYPRRRGVYENEPALQKGEVATGSAISLDKLLALLLLAKHTKQGTDIASLPSQSNDQKSPRQYGRYADIARAAGIIDRNESNKILLATLSRRESLVYFQLISGSPNTAGHDVFAPTGATAETPASWWNETLTVGEATVVASRMSWPSLPAPSQPLRRQRCNVSGHQRSGDQQHKNQHHQSGYQIGGARVFVTR